MTIFHVLDLKSPHCASGSVYQESADLGSGSSLPGAGVLSAELHGIKQCIVDCSRHARDYHLRVPE